MEDPLWNKKGIMGKILNQLITHKNKTKKYVYDETALQYSTDKMTGDKKTDSVLAEKECQLETSMMTTKSDCEGCISFSFPILM